MVVMAACVSLLKSIWVIDFKYAMPKYILLILSFFICSLSYAEIFKWIDEEGNVHFGDKKPASNKTTKVNLKINTYTSVTIDESLLEINKKKKSKEVVMYSAAWCGVCKKAKNYFNQNNISFTEYDIDKDKSARKRHKEMGATGVPVILVGAKRMNGFSVGTFERLYQ